MPTKAAPIAAVAMINRICAPVCSIQKRSFHLVCWIPLIRDSPDDYRTGLDIRDLRGLLQGRREVRRATVISGRAIAGREADLAIFVGIWTHSSHR
jgi:hypothetical protein